MPEELVRLLVEADSVHELAVLHLLLVLLLPHGAVESLQLHLHAVGEEGHHALRQGAAGVDVRAAAWRAARSLFARARTSRFAVPTTTSPPTKLALLSVMEIRFRGSMACTSSPPCCVWPPPAAAPPAPAPGGAPAMPPPTCPLNMVERKRARRGRGCDARERVRTRPSEQLEVGPGAAARPSDRTPTPTPTRAWCAAYATRS